MSESRVLQLPSPSTRGTLLTALLPTLEAADAPRADRSESWLAALLGHAFTFSMARGAGEVWQTANIEWCLFFRELDLLPLRFTSFDAVLRGSRPAPSSEGLRTLKEETWTNVVSGIDRGIPSIAWGAMTLEQKASGIPGFEWCLLVGYDARRRTYTVRHLPHEPSWEVPFDGFGYCDPVNWYHVMTPAATRSVDRPQAVARALDQAIEYAQAKRFDPSTGCNPIDTIGFEAYGLWNEELRRGKADPGFSLGHAGFLRWARTQAALFTREVEQADASEQYETEVEALRRLEDVCRAAAGRGKFESSEVWEAARHLDDALLAERNAIQRLSGGRG